MANTSDGWISITGYGAYLYPPCEPMPSGWFDLQIDDQGGWAEYWDGWNNWIHHEGNYDLRFNASQLEEGVSYEIHWDVSVYGHEIASHHSAFNASSSNWTSIDFSLEIPHWYCGVEIGATMMLDHDGTMVEILSREFYEEGPCENDMAGDFSTLTEVEMELEVIGDGDYRIAIPLHWELDAEFAEFADMVWGDGNGSLNATEIEAIYDEINNESYGDGDGPMILLNDAYPSTWDIDGPVISDISTNPTFSLTWELYYYGVSGVELTAELYMGLEEDDGLFEFTVVGNADLLPLSASSLNMGNGTVNHYNESNGTIEFEIYPDGDYTNYSLSSTWVWAEIPAPSLDIYQFDFGYEGYLPTTSSLTVGVNSFEIILGDLSPQEYSLQYSVILDGSVIDNLTVGVLEELEEFSEYLAYDLSIYSCELEIIATAFDRNGVEANSTTATLQGACAQPELEVHQNYPGWETPEFVCHEGCWRPYKRHTVRQLQSRQ